MIVTNIFTPGGVGTTGTFSFSMQDGSSAIIMNESPANLQLTFPDGSSSYLASYDRRMYKFVGQMAQPHATVTYLVQSIPLTLVLLANQVIVEYYQPGEHVPEIYPAPLIRQLRAFS